MPLAFLLDEHLDPRIAELFQQRGLDAFSIHHWQGGRFLSKPDREILLAAEVEGRVLITRDVGSVPSLLEDLGASGADHAGVVLISSKTFESRSISALARAIENVVSELGDVDWRNRLVFLHR